MRTHLGLAQATRACAWGQTPACFKRNKPCISPGCTHPPLLQTSQWRELGQGSKAASRRKQPLLGQPWTCTSPYPLKAVLTCGDPQDQRGQESVGEASGASQVVWDQLHLPSLCSAFLRSNPTLPSVLRHNKPFVSSMQKIVLISSLI